jgi:hypothetical protein
MGPEVNHILRVNLGVNNDAAAAFANQPNQLEIRASECLRLYYPP